MDRMGVTELSSRYEKEIPIDTSIAEEQHA
jgi:hypothetical protein